MTDASFFAPYTRSRYLKTVAVKDRAIAERLCALLEGAFGVKDIQLYRGFPVVVRDMEWIGGFAMRVQAPMVYCCSREVFEEMGAELQPLMSGKYCLALRAKGSMTLDDAFALVKRAYKIMSQHGGMICKADQKKREKLRAAEGEVKSPTRKSAKTTAKTTAKKAAKKLVKKGKSV